LDEVEAGVVHKWDEVQAVYCHPERESWRASASGLTTRAIKAARNGHTVPPAEHCDALTQAAALLARESLEHRGIPVPVDGAAACVALLRANASAASPERSCRAYGWSLGTSNSRVVLHRDVSEACFPTFRGAAGGLFW
jgi:hypothetical protein